MTKNQLKAIKKLEESSFADIQSKTAQSLYVLGFIEINGFSQVPSHLNCSLRQQILFPLPGQSEGVSARNDRTNGQAEQG